MSILLSFFASRKGIVSAGIFIGLFAPILQKLMPGVCPVPNRLFW